MKLWTLALTLMLLAPTTASIHAQGRGNGRGNGNGRGGPPETPVGRGAGSAVGGNVVSVPDGDSSTALLLMLSTIGIGGVLLWNRRARAQVPY